MELFKGFTGNLFERIQILKTFVVPLFLNVAGVFPIPSCLMASLYSVFFSFLWGCKISRVKRNITYQKVGDGGLNMLNPEVFFGLYFFFQNLKPCFLVHSQGWVGFLGGWMLPFLNLQGELLRDKRVSLRMVRYPSYVISFLKMLFSWRISKEMICKYSRKVLYWNVIEECFTEPVVLVNCPPVYKEQVLGSLATPGLPNNIKTVLWYALHNKLLVKCNIKHRVMSDYSCPRESCSGVMETQSHLFLECPYAVEVWKLLFLKFKVQIPFSYNALVYGIFPNIFQGQRAKALYIIFGIAKFFLWNDRYVVLMGRRSWPVDVMIKSILRKSEGVATKEKDSMSDKEWRAKWAGFNLDTG
nr:PREDICTED: uncharacterized protein LOC106706018 [Latimeria chalumnae]|eukprot:XP_014351838.1 PREDICTED: uncharacterized protein LOC106706018 [Latimeria chalumnae]